MTAQEFEDQLRRDGYLDIRHRLLQRGEDTQPHGHAFDTRLMIEAGEMTVVCGQSRRTYRSGEVFEIPAGVEHCECYADAPVRFIAGLRHAAA